LIDLPKFDDIRGCLVPLDFEQLPFSPARLFTVSGVRVGAVRGCHALVDQQQLLVCLVGSVEVEVRRRSENGLITLDRPDVGLLIDSGVWSSQRFTAEGSILLGVASGKYDPDGYQTEVPGVTAE
jgi:dTDP-4-dehydrorhamnose 3,5-epimerase-like enzyme